MQPFNPRRATPLLLCSLLLLAAAGYAHAQQANVYLNIPLDLRNLMDEVSGVHIHCKVTTENSNEVLGSQTTHVYRQGSKDMQLIHEMEIAPSASNNFSAASQYHCLLRMIKDDGNFESESPPVAADPQGDENDWKRYDPSEPFVIEISGPLTPDVVQVLQGNQAFQANQ